MTIGIPKEIKEQEQRVGLLPSTAQTLVGHGHTVLVQKNAGVGCGYPDEEYVKAGAQIVESAEEIFQRADMIVKVKEPLPAEWPLLRRRKPYSPRSSPWGGGGGPRSLVHSPAGATAREDGANLPPRAA